MDKISNRKLLLLAVVLLVSTKVGIVIGFTAVAIGDFGDDSDSGRQRQETISQVMSDYCGVRTCDFVLSAGDNFYEHGVTSLDDPRFDNSWAWVYNKTHIEQLRWYHCLGNHDYGVIDDRELYQVNYTEIDQRWYLPWLWYDFVIDGPDFNVHFIVLDAMSILIRKYDWEAELEWYNQTLQESTADWKVVMEHYPPYSAGGYAPGSLIHRNALVPLAEQYGVDLFIAGHDHNLQHLTKKDQVDIDYIVTAGGGRRLYGFDDRGNQTLDNMGFSSTYFNEANGFVLLEFTRDTIVADYVDMAGDLVYSFTRSRN